jgi:GNAT superfamily N-acetyltransferase
VTLRPATQDDVAALVDLVAAFYEEDGFMTEHAVLRGRLAALLAQPSASLTLAVTSDAPVGFALTTVRLVLESGLVAELQDLYVRPEQRGRGVGSALVADAARWARDGGAEVLDVVIAPNGRDVAHLHRYYASRGFVDDGRRLLHREL